MNKSAYHLNEKEVKKIQEIEFEILQYFIDVCNKLNLTYYLHGGTLLGAKMYGNFIPWDDDIDVSMPRDDYEILLEKGQEYLPKHLFIQSCYNDKEYTLCFAKIRNTNTKLIEYLFQNRKKMINGVYIDIFPIDGMKNKRKNIYVRALRRRIDMSYWSVECCNIFKRIIISLMIFPFLFVSANKATRLLDTYRKKNRVADSDNPSVMLINRWYYPPCYYIPKSNNKILFNGIEMNTVRNEHSWLLIDYPEYQIIPPKDKQIPGHRLVYHCFD